MCLLLFCHPVSMGPRYIMTCCCTAPPRQKLKGQTTLPWRGRGEHILYIYIYVYTHIHTYTCVYHACMHACMHVCRYIYIRNMYICICVCINIDIHTYIYILYICMYIYLYIYIHTHTHTHTHARAHTNTHAPRDAHTHTHTLGRNLPESTLASHPKPCFEPLRCRHCESELV